ncbi:MAG: glycosyltransferase family 39 protein [Phycisphaerales bacterium]|nr:glycosyltransferase family 39 protein [Phycisphaerales bacterium]
MTPPICDPVEVAASRRFRRHALLIVVAAALLRALWALAVPVEPVSDSARYDFFAQRLAAGLGYTEAGGRPTAYWPVGPSFLYSLAFRCTGNDTPARFQAAAVLNLLLGVGAVALVIVLGRTWVGPRAALAGGWLLTLWPSQIQFTTVLNSELPMVFFMLLAAAVWWPAMRRPAAWHGRALVAGVCLAAAAYMRPTALLLPVVFCLPGLVWGPRRLVTVAGGVLMVAALVGVLLPWSLRNQRELGDFVLISTNGGVNFWMGNNPQAWGGYMPPPPMEQFGSEPARDRGLKAEALAYIRAEPAAFAKRTLVKAVRLHERESIGIGWNEPGLRRALAGVGGAGASGAGSSTAADRVLFAAKLATNVYWWLVLLLAVVGVGRMLLVGPRFDDASPAVTPGGGGPGGGAAGRLLGTLLSPPVLMWGYFTAVHAVSVIQDRYHFAAIPAIALLAGVAVVGWTQARVALLTSRDVQRGSAPAPESACTL